MLSPYPRQARSLRFAPERTTVSFRAVRGFPRGKLGSVFVA